MNNYETRKGHILKARQLRREGGFFNGMSAKGSTFHELSMWHLEQAKRYKSPKGALDQIQGSLEKITSALSDIQNIHSDSISRRSLRLLIQGEETIAEGLNSYQEVNSLHNHKCT